MRREEIHGFLRAEPFQPFEVHVADGRRFQVPHREFAAVHPTGRTLLVFGHKGQTHHLNLTLVTGIAIADDSGANGTPN